MFKFIKFVVFFGLAAGWLWLAGPAARAYNFNANRLVDDAVFDNAGSMDANTINGFLNSFSNSCISPSSGFEARIPDGYSPSAGFHFGDFVTAGQVISQAAQVYSINPQVLLVTLEKEQSLVGGRSNFSGYCNNGDEHKYAAAMGYGCPDSGGTYSWDNVSLYRRNGVERTSTGTTCVNTAAKAGFSQQVIRAAWLLKFGEQRSYGNTSWAVVSGNWNNSDDPGTCYGGPMTEGLRKRCSSDSQATFFDGYITIDNSSTHMDNGSTAALYWYTPHFSGNQNFDNLFASWFGSPINACGHDPSDQLATSGRHSVGDFSGDGRTDAAVFRPSDGCWHIRAFGDFLYGQSGDIPVPGDYNGDGKTDAAVFRPSDGYWHVRGMGDFLFGQSGDIPVPADYNGDGKTDIAIYRPGDGYWHIRGVGDFQHGQPGDIPVPADYNGDGRADGAVYRPLDGGWRIRAFGDFPYGWSTDIPAPADYNGDGKTDIAIYRPGDGYWHIRGVGDFQHGQPGDIPVPADYNGDGKTDIAIYRPGDGGWRVRAVGDFPHGWSTDIPAIQTLNAYLLKQYGLISNY